MGGGALAPARGGRRGRMACATLLLFVLLPIFLLLAKPSSADNTVVMWYDGFCAAGGLRLLRSASTTSRDLILSSPRAGSEGGATLEEAVPLLGGFTAAVTFTLEGARSAGFAFVVQSAPAGTFKGGDGGMGFSGMTDAVAVLLDRPDGDGPWVVSLHLPDADGSLANLPVNSTEQGLAVGYALDAGVRLADGAQHTMELTYSAAGNGTLDAAVDHKSHTWAGVLLADALRPAGPANTSAFVGFTASGMDDGARHSSVHVLDWTLGLPAAPPAGCLDGFSAANGCRAADPEECDTAGSCGVCLRQVSCCAWCGSSRGCLPESKADASSSDQCAHDTHECHAHAADIMWFGVVAAVLMAFALVLSVVYLYRKTTHERTGVIGLASRGSVLSGLVPRLDEEDQQGGPPLMDGPDDGVDDW